MPPPPTAQFDCSSTADQCLNGGTCVASGGVDNAFCSCVFGFGGQQCENGKEYEPSHHLMCLMICVFCVY
jgi:hypothetical protein